jgi:hypothetical protein
VPSRVYHLLCSYFWISYNQLEFQHVPDTDSAVKATPPIVPLTLKTYSSPLIAPALPLINNAEVAVPDQESISRFPYHRFMVALISLPGAVMVTEQFAVVFSKDNFGYTKFARGSAAFALRLRIRINTRTNGTKRFFI